MANMRVYELAKELNITTKDIADLLDNNNKTYKTMSGLNDDEVAKVRGKFGHKSGAAGNASKPKNEKANEAKMTENNTPKKDITKESVKTVRYFCQRRWKSDEYSGNNCRSNLSEPGHDRLGDLWLRNGIQ